VQRFLEASPEFPKDKADGSIRPMTVSRLLRKAVYAGYMEAPGWDISLRKGKHEGLISFETFERIQENLAGRKRGPAGFAEILRGLQPAKELFALAKAMLRDACT
jgi:site-specific DNA recombinase